MTGILRAFWRKIRADWRANRFQMGLIFFILVLSTMALTISLIVNASADDPWDRTFEEANGPHVWLLVREPNADLSVIKDMPEVSETSGEIQALAHVPLLIEGEQNNIFLYAMDEPPPVARPLLQEGRWISPQATDEVMLDFSLATYFDLEVGDSADFLTAEGVQSLKIVGLVVSSHWITYTDDTREQTGGMAYISSATLQRLEPDRSRWVTSLGVRLHEPEKSREFQDKLHALPDVPIETSFDWKWLRQIVTFTNAMIVNVMRMFSILGLIAVGFIIANTISGQLLAQYRDIGMLKAVGFTPRQVTGLFLLEYGALGLGAALVGLAIGMALGPAFASPMAELLNTTTRPVFDPALMITVLVSVVGGVLLFTSIPAWRASRINTIQAITVGYARRRHTPSWAARTAMRLGLSPVTMIGVKDVFARPSRALFTVLGLVLTIVTLVFAIGANETVKELGANRFYFRGTAGDIQVARNFVSDVQMRAILAQYPEVRAFYSHRIAFGRAESIKSGETMPIHLRALSDDYRAFDFGLLEGRMFEEEGEAIVGYGILDNLDLEMGETVTFDIEGKLLTVKIVGYYAELLGLGNVIMTDLATYQQQLNPTGVPEVYNLRVAPGTDRNRLAGALEADGGGQFDIKIIKAEPNRTSLLLRSLAQTISGLILLVALVNLFSTGLLSVRERRREFGIEKAIGFTPRQLMQAVVTQLSALALLALLIGIPAGLVFFDVFMGGIGVAVGTGPTFGQLNEAALVLLLPFMVLLALLSGMIPARRAARINVVDALRYE